MSDMQGDICEFCDGRMEHQIIMARFRYKKQTIYVENVPAWVCNQCGEVYYDAEVVERLEKIAQRREEIERTISFPLAEYSMALT